MLPWKRIILGSAILLLDSGALLLLIVLSMSYGDETDLLEDEAYQRFEHSVTLGWWFWWGLNAALLARLLYRLLKQRAAAPSTVTER
ncbi:hypothetical protein BXP70_27430 [Hymenobacter crusticola]|uniref:Transmembrane protein n=2 Tax=Hymenobacter crusticola TaxID=1770526 RepID=A0A243W5J7_9BACT|nr:hypothetical protein BXP70_27430 [Hymenobacter crusticola]